MNNMINITVITTTDSGSHLHFNATVHNDKDTVDRLLYKHFSDIVNELAGDDIEPPFGFCVTLFRGEEDPITLTDEEVFEGMADYELYQDDLRYAEEEFVETDAEEYGQPIR